jgi:hypothetical protein
VYGDSQFHLALPFERHIEEHLIRLISQTAPDAGGEGDHTVLARRIVDLITAMLDGEVLPPTPKQLKYATAIAQELALELPPEVLHYRSAMTVFLGTYALQYRRRKDSRRTIGAPGHDA